jgi:hypothetical protein
MDNQNQSGSQKNSQTLNADGVNSNFTNDNNAFELDDNTPFNQKPVFKSQPKKIQTIMKDEIKAPALDTDKNLDLLIRNAAEVDDRTKDLLIKNRTLIQQLFPSKIDKMIIEMQRNTIQTAMEFRLNLYKMSTQFRLEALREKYNAALMTIRGHYREQVSEFMMGKLEELHTKVDVKQRSFIEFAKAKYDYAKLQSGYPSLQTLYLNNINEESIGYLNFLHRQITNFESIIDEQIERIN